MKLISWNVNGICSACRNGLVDFIKEQTPDILCLQETKTHPDRLKEEEKNFAGYQSIFSPAIKPGYSGTATIFRPGYLPEKTRKGIGIKCYDNEGRFLITDHGEFLLCNTYFPSGTTGEVRQNFKYRFLDDFLAFLKTLPARDFSRLIICGDLNICHKELDIHHPKEAEKRQLSGFLAGERSWFDRFIEAGFVDTFRLMHGPVKDQYSWWSYRAGSRARNLGWRIDYIMVSEKLAPRVIEASIFPEVKGSDHCPVSISLR